MGITFNQKGSFDHTEGFLRRMFKRDIFDALNTYGQAGVYALSAATPVDSGMTAASWDYEIDTSGGNYTIAWINTNVNKGARIAVLIQYGHGTGTGGWVEGYDYINPTLRPIFDEIADNIWKAVTSA